MISNFQIKQGASLPWLEVEVTKNGLVELGIQSPSYSCNQDTSNPNALDLSSVQSVEFELYKCGRVPQKIGLSGSAEVNDAAKGIVTYKWHPSDTQVAGLYYGSFILNFTDGSMLKWPYQLEALTIEVLQ